GLRARDVVGNSAEAGSAGGEIQLEPGGPRVAVARLADRAGVQKPAAGVQPDLRSARREVALEAPGRERERERDVTVPDEDDRCDRPLERIARGLLGDHVLPDRIPRARVIELGAFDL